MYSRLWRHLPKGLVPHLRSEEVKWAMAYDSTKRSHVAIQRRATEVEDSSCDAFIKHAMGVVDGRVYFHRLLVRCHVFSNPFDGNARVSAFNCGELNIGQQVFADIMRLVPDDYVQMMREAHARSTATDVRLNRSDEDARRDDPGPRYVHPAFTSLDGGQAHDDYDASGDEGTGDEE